MVGFGYDVHRLAQGESLILGGIAIPSDMGTVAHSDGDVLLHAVVDAILGAVAMGDIGEHFPDTDPQWRGAASSQFVEHAVRMITEAGYRLVNLDATLVLERPKILPFKQQMRDHIAAITGLPVGRVSLKATTSETIGFVGRLEGVQAYCICEVQPA
jgi:2-C-methyl-D-erythritol 2,4-cyclodiphosphate synthase